MFRNTALVAVVIGLTSASPGASAGTAIPCQEIPTVDSRCEVWTSRSDVTSSDEGRLVEVTPDGALAVLVGSTDDSLSAQADMVVMGLDGPTGAPRWSARLDIGVDGGEDPTALVLDASRSRVFVGGTVRLHSSQRDGDDAFVVALDLATGAVVWKAQYDSGLRRSDILGDLALSPDGTVIAAAVTSAEIGRLRAGVVAFDARAGSVAWVARSDSPAASWGKKVAFHPSGDVVYAAGEESVGGGSDLWIRGIHAAGEAAGTTAWTVRASLGLQEYLGGLILAPDGSRGYLGATDWGGDGIGAVAFDTSSGAIHWTTADDDFDTESMNAVALSPAGDRLYLTGTKPSLLDLGDDMVTVALDASTGDEAWTATYSFAPSSVDVAEDVGVAADGTVLVTGYSQPYDLRDTLTIAYDPTGTERWIARHNSGEGGNNVDQATALAVAGTRVVLVGTSTASANSDLLVSSYTLSGG